MAGQATKQCVLDLGAVSDADLTLLTRVHRAVENRMANSLQRPETAGDTQTLRESGCADGGPATKQCVPDLGAVSDADLTRVKHAIENRMANSLQLPETNTRTLREPGCADCRGG